MNIESRKLSELIYAEYNPRKLLTKNDPEYQKISRSITEFGYVDPIIINSDNTIIGGHQRVTVLKDLGYDDVQVVVVELPKEREKALNIALNKITGEWDIDKLVYLIEELDSLDVDVTLTGFDRNEIEDLLNQIHADDKADEDDFDADAEYESITEPVSKPGDVWMLGRHRLMCGDACNPDDVAKLMDGAKANLTVTDPPYNVDYEGGTEDKLKIQNDNMDDEAFHRFLYNAFKNMYDFSEPGAATYVFHADSEGLNFRKAYKEAGFLLKQCLIWKKNSMVLGRQDYQWIHEPILYGWKDGAAHYFTDCRSLTTVLEYDRPTRNIEHPTMKPLALIGDLIKNSSKPGWIVQDYFGGSGSTLIACEQVGRTAYLMEIDPKYVDVVIRRWEILTGNKAKLIL